MPSAQATSIHGDLSQEQRSAAVNAFKNGSIPLLVATDVAARGLDIPDVELVLNYSFPLTVEDYCHRIGRTGRAGKTGLNPCQRLLPVVFHLVTAKKASYPPQTHASL